MTEESCLKEYVDKFIHPSKQWQLKEIVDPDCDLPEIAKHITEWETKLAIPLGLTQTEISDIKKVGRSDPTQPIIERLADFIISRENIPQTLTSSIFIIIYLHYFIYRELYYIIHINNLAGNKF